MPGALSKNSQVRGITIRRSRFAELWRSKTRSHDSSGCPRTSGYTRSPPGFGFPFAFEPPASQIPTVNKPNSPIRLSVILLLVGLLAGAALWSGAKEKGVEPAEARPNPTLKVDPQPVARTGGGGTASYADMLETATPSVVGVVTTEVISMGNRSGPRTLEDLFRRFYGLPPDPDAEEEEEGDAETGPDERRVPTGMGSGVIVSPEGYILTNNHVVRSGRGGELADEVLVQIADGREFTAEIVGTDAKTDIAVLRIDAGEPLPALTLADTDNLRVGDVCFAIGNPLRVGLTVTKGIVSALGRTDVGILGMRGYEDFIQTDAAINMGNSGGALVDSRGRLIGINTAILSRTGGNIGIGFAIPANLARYVMENLIESGEVPRGYLGVFPGNLTPELAEAWGLPSTKGALIRQVEEDGPAAKAGIRHRDVITEVDGRGIDTARELRVAIAQTPPGETVTLRIIRDGKEITKDVKLGNLGTVVADAETEATEEGALPNMVLEPLTAENRAEFSVPSSVEGVLIAEITRVTPRIQSFRPGMVISEVNNRPVRSAQEVAEALRPGINTLYVWFENGYNFLTYER